MVTLSLIIILNDLMSKNNNKKNIINKNIKRKIFSIALKYKYLVNGVPRKLLKTTL